MLDRVPLDSSCPDLADLLLASEGELSRRRQAEVSTHLRQCSSCRSQLGDVSLAMREYQDAVNTSVAETAETPDRFDQFRIRLQQERRTVPRRLPVHRWLPIAALVPVLVTAMLFSGRYTSIVRAEELLTRAAAQERTLPAGTIRRLEIHVRRSTRAGGARQALNSGTTPPFASWSFSREVGRANDLLTASGFSSEDKAGLARLLHANHFDWADPLSVASFRAWRDSLPDKRESIVDTADAFILHTSTPSGGLRSAELVVRRTDFQPVRQTLDFDGFGEVEIVEVSRWVTSPSTLARAPEAAPSHLEMQTSNTSFLDDTEIDVRTTLHQLAADGAPGLVVGRSAHAIEIHGTVAGRQKAAIEGALSRFDLVHVLLRSETPTSASPTGAATEGDHPRGRDVAPLVSSTPVNSTPSEAPTAPTSVHASANGKTGADSRGATATTAPLQEWLEKTFGRGERPSTFLQGLSDDAEEVQWRSVSFAALAARYPDSETRRLAVPVRRKLDILVEAQYRDLVQAVEQLDSRLALFLGTTTRPAFDRSAPHPWQACATAVVVRADQLNQAIHDVLRERELPMPTEIGAGRDEPPPLANLRVAVNALCDQLRVGVTSQLTAAPLLTPELLPAASSSR